MQKDTDEKLVSCSQNSKFNILQKNVNFSYKLDNIPDIPNDENSQVTEVSTPHKNLYTKGAYHSESATDLYLQLKGKSPHYVACLFEDFRGENTLENLQKTWLLQNDNSGGVFNAIHPNKDNADAVGVIQNATYLEYKQGDDAVEDVQAGIYEFISNVEGDIQKLNSEGKTMHFKLLNDNKVIVNDILSKSSILLKELPQFNKFLQTKFSSSQSTPSSGFLLNKNKIESALKNINIILNNDGITGSVNYSLSDNDREALNVYQNVLLKMLDAKFLHERLTLLQGVQDNKSITDVQIAKETVLSKMKKAKEDIKTLKQSFPINNNAVEALEQDIIFLQKNEDNYSNLLDIVSPLYPNEIAYNEIFEQEIQNGEVVTTRLKNATATIQELRDYHKWIGETIFKGMSSSVNEDVKAVLVASAYRGDISPKSLNEALLGLSHTNSQAEFYTIILNILNGGESALEELKGFMNKNSSFSDVKDSVITASANWNNEDLLGNNPSIAHDNPLLLKESDSIQAFIKEWGFNVNLAFSDYKKLNAQKSHPQGDDLQGLPRLNGNVLDMSLWIDKNGNVNNSAEMKSYLSRLVSSIQSNNSANITDEKKELYATIMSGNWTGNESDIKVFIKTLKSNFKAQEKFEYTNGIDSIGDIVKKALIGAGDDSGNISETFSYAWDQAKNLELPYVGLFGVAAWLLLKDTSNSNFLVKLLKGSIMLGGGGAAINYFVKDLSGLDMVDSLMDGINGEDKRLIHNPAWYSMMDMKERELLDKTEDETNLSEKQLLVAGTVVASANLQEVLEWYNGCNSAREAERKNPYSTNIPREIKKHMHLIYNSEGNVGVGKTGEDSAKAVYKFVDLYLRNESLKKDPNAGDGIGNPAIGHNILADTYPVGDITYESDGVLKYGRTFGEVMWASLSREKMQRLKEKNTAIAEDIASGARSTVNATADAWGRVTDDTTMTNKSEKNIIENTATRLAQLSSSNNSVSV